MIKKTFRSCSSFYSINKFNQTKLNLVQLIKLFQFSYQSSDYFNFTGVDRNEVVDSSHSSHKSSP